MPRTATGMLDRLRGQGPCGASGCRAEASDEDTGTGAAVGNWAWAVGGAQVMCIIIVQYVDQILLILIIAII